VVAVRSSGLLGEKLRYRIVLAKNYVNKMISGP
jgi:hypothetical protein